MKLFIQGVFAVSTGNRTIVAFRSPDGHKQYFSLPEDKEAAIAPALTERGFAIENLINLVYSGTGVVLITESQHFNRVEIVPLSTEDANQFFIALQSDKDVEAFINKVGAEYEKRSEELFAAADKVAALIPEDGATGTLIKQIAELNWASAVSEVLKAVHAAYPEKIESLRKYLNPAAQAWLAAKLK